MADDALARLQSGAAEIAPEGGLAEKLSLGRPLRVKLGLDPTAPAVTLGWAVVLRKLRQFQDAGHQAVLIVGDFTARVGDPSGRSSTRPTLSKEQVDAFADRLLSQFWKVIDRDRVELRRNSEWLEPLGVEDVLRLTASTTVARMLERDDFADRYAAKKPISLMEFLYPLLQGYDSVAVEADVELGGTDQLFNLLVGRELQKDAGQAPQIALTMPLLEGLDGVQKMSQSLGNYVGVDEQPEDMFGKLMSIRDDLIARYELLCTDLGPEDNVRVVAGLADGSLHPNTEKRRVARAIVDLYHGDGSGRVAEQRFDLVHKQHRIPEDVQDVRVPRSVFRKEPDGIWNVHIPALLEALGLVRSRSEARRLQAQGGVRMNGLRQSAEDLPIDGEPPGPMAGSVWQVGRRRFARLAGLAD
ncbi:MAG: tyrosine--tRNA ligase [Actinobacteria bacterium]|nr:MAG: tyrosine--tRNA ligase [Actinomycetota bacterium]